MTTRPPTPTPPPVPTPPRQASVPPPVPHDVLTPVEEKPWGPIRLRWKGHYLSPELASVVFLLALALTFAAGAGVWHALRSSPLTPGDVPGPTDDASTTSPPVPVSRRSSAQLAASSKRAKPTAETPGPTPRVFGAPDHPAEPAPRPTALVSGDRTAQNPATPATARPVTYAKPLISSFAASAEAISPGGSATLSWVVSGDTDKVIISPEPGLVRTSGTYSIRPEHSMQYVITATGPGGASTDQLLVHVNAVSAPTVDFGVDNAQVKLGQTATLHWTVNGADQVSIDPSIGPVNASGSYRVKPLGTVRYNLVAQGPGGASGRTVIVQVTGNAGPSSGELIWSGVVNGSQLVTIDHDHADFGHLTGALPGVPCILQPADERRVSIASAPGTGNNFDRLVLRVTGHGMTNVLVRWALQ